MGDAGQTYENRETCVGGLQRGVNARKVLGAHTGVLRPQDLPVNACNEAMAKTALKKNAPSRKRPAEWNASASRAGTPPLQSFLLIRPEKDHIVGAETGR
jgi:hypothetical protein